MEPREERRRQARRLIGWALGMITGLLVLYVRVEGAHTPWIGAMAAVITATAALGGVFLGSHLAQRQRREEDQQRRRALATMFLSELRLLEQALREVCEQSPKTSSIQATQTTVYDQAGAHLLLFSPDTVQALIGFYQQVPKVQALARAWRADRQLLGPVHDQLWHSGIGALQTLP